VAESTSALKGLRVLVPVRGTKVASGNCTPEVRLPKCLETESPLVGDAFGKYRCIHGKAHNSEGTICGPFAVEFKIHHSPGAVPDESESFLLVKTADL
jgi:hypothetical protein